MCYLVKHIQHFMDHTDIVYIIELLEDAIQNEDWDIVHEALDFIKEYRDDDGSPIELEE
jgi:hemerythrin-like domain-containing protein